MSTGYSKGGNMIPKKYLIRAMVSAGILLFVVDVAAALLVKLV